MDRTSVVTTGPLENLRGRVDRWRAGCGGKRSRVPQELWAAAVEVAGLQGVYAASRATRLNYQSLKDRMGRAAETRATRSPTFIEVAMPAVTARDEASRTVIELDRAGERLRVEVTRTSAVDVVSMAHAFWSRER